MLSNDPLHGAPGGNDIYFSWCHQSRLLARSPTVCTMTNLLHFADFLLIALGFLASFTYGCILGADVVNPYCCF
jgi:hypothetical protein